MTEKDEWLLKFFFIGDVAKLSLPLGFKLFDERANKVVYHAENIPNYIDVDKVKKQLCDEYFKYFFNYDNLNMPVIKSHIIEKLSEFEDFNLHTNGRDFNYKDKSNVNSFWFEKFTGQRSSDNFPYQFSRTVLYHSGYEKNKQELNKYGIGFIGGGTVADYILSGIYKLKPHVLEALETLK